MSQPDFKNLATEWLVRAQGHSRAPHEASLAEELRRMYELGAADAIEAVRDCCWEPGGRIPMTPPPEGEEIIERIRDATAPKG